MGAATMKLQMNTANDRRETKGVQGGGGIMTMEESAITTCHVVAPFFNMELEVTLRSTKTDMCRVQHSLTK